ncbi:hypothetical protein [Algoriphagus antarcticus]|uniref:Uncharacterized protein n=1 Tax=Algoriphagus antarcticus TaxID=238540 RepID=A0A3E0DPL0_9BACT|nr:hypothetical protein [Algoriphagus antarcticus]REG84799.1 hypothetical protein C8N25_114148 [Algoriphagus antarcticus]
MSDSPKNTSSTDLPSKQEMLLKESVMAKSIVISLGRIGYESIDT